MKWKGIEVRRRGNTIVYVVSFDQIDDEHTARREADKIIHGFTKDC